MKVLLEFRNSHHYIAEYEKSKYFCPNCGKQEVWEEQGEGDYYAGSSYICTSCSYTSYLDRTMKADSAWAKIPEQLISGVMTTPTTEKGN
jgi:predicted RNA-binding Zn-ribbon protein involved in translation (DUF1610 family)